MCRCRSRPLGCWVFHINIYRRQVLENKIKPGGPIASEASVHNGGPRGSSRILLLDAQISIYSYCCHLEKRNSRTSVE